MTQSSSTNSLQRHLNGVIERIHRAEQRFGRAPDSVHLLAVSKTRPAEDLAAAFELGQRSFGESYLQEALTKIEALQHLPIEWHFIGPIQSNKTKGIAEHFDWVHSIDRLKTAHRLNDQRPPGMAPLDCCLQVNIDNEPSKSGVTLRDLPTLAHAVAELPALRLRGLMAVPQAREQFEEQRRPFRALREALEILNREGLALDTLSIGMSDDLEAAVAEGATWVRIGTAIFGSRARP